MGKASRTNRPISEHAKPGKAFVVELDDEVEYIVDDRALQGIESGKQQVSLIRVVDRAPQTISVRRIQWGIAKNGIIDYLDREQV